MNLKDRLVISKQNNVIKQNSENDNYKQLTFNNEQDIMEILQTENLKDKNLIFVSDRNTDKSLIVNFTKKLYSDCSFSITEYFNPGVIDTGKINIIKNPSIKDLVKVFETSITGYSRFVCCFCLNNSDNITEKIRTLIAINYPSLKESNINTLFSNSNCLIVSITKEDSDYFATQIQEITDRNEIKILYPVKTVQEEEITNIIQDTEINTEENILIDNELLNYNIEEHKPAIDETNDFKEIKNTKVNKYKLLRDKVQANKNK